MQIEERVVDGVTILDLKGKMTLGEGDELLKDKINSLIQQDKKKLLLNLEGVPYIDSAGLGEIVRTYTTVSRQGGKLKLLNLTKRIQDLLAITKLLTVFETYDPNRKRSRASSKARLRQPAALRMARHSVPDIIEQAEAAPDRPARPASRWPSASSSRCGPRSGRRTSSSSPALIFGQRLLGPVAPSLLVTRGLRRLLRAVRRRLSGQRRRRSRGRPPASAQAHRPIASGALPVSVALGDGGAPRRRRARGRVLAPFRVRRRRDRATWRCWRSTPGR